MIKKKYVKRIYIEEAICDKCGSLMKPAGYVLPTHPARYSYICSNEKCDFTTSFFKSDCPGQLKYEFEDEVEDEWDIK